MIMNLNQALRVIKSTLFHNQGSNYFPYFFIVGAGISVPEIPAASKIIEICKDTAHKFDNESFIKFEKETEQFKNNAMKYYSSWIEHAFPNRINRSKLFKDLCSKSKISSANLMLAQILNSGQFANTVFTTNFDDSIKKALDLIGAKNYFCAENKMDNLVIDTKTKDTIQVVHVHGTFNFYDCANLEKEIDNIASQSGTISSSRLLSSFLSNQAPIIVGYSGWENDVIMTCLKERLTYPTPLQYLWICYDKNSYSILPDWIKDNDSIIFVVPDNELICEEEHNANSWNNTDNRDAIDATMFFKRIISDNKLEPPIIFTDPHKYYSQKIESLLPKNEDVLHLRNWTKRLKLLESDDAFEQLLQQLENAYISKNYDKASDVVLEMSKLQLNVTNAEFVCTNLIRDIIKEEDAISSFEERLSFHISSLKFINNNLHQLYNTESLISTMKKILFTRFGYSDIEKMISLFDQTIEVAKKDEKLLLIELTGLAIKSEYANKEDKKKFLKEVISRCPSDQTNKNFVFLKFRALCKLATIICSSESIALIKDAERLLLVLSDDTLNVSICSEKTKLIPYIDDIDTKEAWMNDVFNVLIHPIESIDKKEYIEMISYLLFVDLELLKKYSTKNNIETILIEFVRNYVIDASMCHIVWQYSQCCLLICNISEDQTIIEEFSRKIIEISNGFKHECDRFTNVLSYALKIYMSLPEEIVDSDKKIRIILNTKETFNANSVYFDILDYTYNRKTLNDYSIFDDDIEYVYQQNEELNNGYNMYFEGKKKEAENAFKELLNCKVSQIQQTARTNLGFMVRRNEADCGLSFEEIMHQQNHLSGFDYMNILLFYCSRGMTENEQYQNAVIELNKISEEEKIKIIDFWSKIDIVGVEESQLALSYLKT